MWNFDTKTVTERYLATERCVVDIISRNFEWQKSFKSETFQNRMGNFSNDLVN